MLRGVWALGRGAVADGGADGGRTVVVTRPASPFGALLRGHRLAAGLTQEGLAECADLSARAVSDLERGVKRGPRPDTLRLLARALGLDSEARSALAAAARTAAPASPARPQHLPSQS